MMKTAALTVLAILVASPVLAQSAGDWQFGIGVRNIKYVDDGGLLNGRRVETRDANRATITGEYFLRDNLGVEILATMPARQVAVYNGNELGSAKQFPVSAIALYRLKFTPKTTPFIGAGVGYTGFYDETAEGASAAEIKVRDSWGLALAVGTDFAINDHSAIRADMRWSDTDTNVLLKGDEVGRVRLNPTSLGISYLMKF